MMNLFRSKKDLFEFKHGDIEWLFTSAAKPVTHNEKTYLPLVRSRSNIEVEDIDKTEIEVSFPYPMQIKNADGDDIQQLFANKIYYGGVSLTILELYKNETLVIFKGRVVQPKFSNEDNTMTLVCSTADTYQNRNILTRKFQKPCANKIYDRFCGLKFEDWAVGVTVTSINALTVIFTVNPTVKLDENGDPVLDANGDPVMEIKEYDSGYFARGLLLKNAIYTSILGSGDDSIQLYRNHFGLEVGDIVKLAPACDQTRQVCHEKFNNSLRFMGFPNIPTVNPTMTQIVR
ncbi:MAG: phage BR0599 family protein [Acinetobacter sp.]